MLGNEPTYPGSAEPVHDPSSFQINLRHVMIRNVQVSVLVTSCTVIGLSVLIGICLQYHGANIPPEDDYIQMWAIFSPNVDMFLTSIILHSVTSVWLPQRVQNVVALHFSPDEHMSSKLSRVKSVAVSTGAPGTTG